MQAPSNLLIGAHAASIFTRNGPTYVVRIPAGKVSTDLAGFPVMVDLSHLPSSFWERVRTDGGNIRAYTGNNVTRLPVDVTYVNKKRRIGRMYVRMNLLTASDNMIYFKVLGTTKTAESVTHMYGRNSVWTGFEVVWVYPETTNRTGKTHTQNTSLMLEHSEYIRTAYNVLTGNPHNGICTDGTHFISADDIALRRMNMSYVVQQTVADINTVLNPQGIMNIDHMGDPVCVGASFFITVTDTTSTYRRWLVKLKTSDLTYEGAWEMTGAQRVFGATVCYDGNHLLLFSYTDGTKFIKYTTAGSYVSDVALDTTTVGIQGSTVMPNGNIYISYDPATIMEILPDGRRVGKVYTDPHASIMEGLENRDGNLWLLKGNGPLITLRNDVHQDFRKMHGGDSATAVFPTSTVYTAATTVYWTTTDTQQNFIEIADDALPTNSARSTGLLYDEGPDQIGIWNSTDTWLYVSPTLRPVAYETFRLAFAYNGTTERKVRARKGATNYTGTDATVSARPLGTSLRFSQNKDGEAYYQYTWIRLQYMTEAWLQADMDNNYSPSTFYTVETIDSGWYSLFRNSQTGTVPSWSNYTGRNVIARALLPDNPQKVKIRLRAATANAVVLTSLHIGFGKRAIFGAAPVPLNIGGTNSYTIPANTAVWTDEVDISGIGAADDLIMSWYVPSGSGGSDTLPIMSNGSFFLSGGYASGNVSTTVGGTFTTNNTQQYLIEEIRVKTDKGWETVYTEAFTYINNSWNGYTIRTRIELDKLTLSKNFRIGFFADIGECFVGNAATTAGSYEFLSTPVRVTFGGANGYTAGELWTHFSDVIALSGLDPTKPLIVSQYQNGNNVAHDNVNNAGVTSKYKSGNSANSMSWGSASDYWSLGPVRIDQQN